jgi:predicted acetyltransferase
MVATAGAFSLEMAVSGAVTPMAGVTMVGVRPTHRRRGLLTGLMSRQLHDVADAGQEPLAVLWASEPGIYGRFGYGRAATALDIEIRREYAEFSEPVDDAGRLTLADPESVRDALAEVYDAVWSTRPGYFRRDKALWAMRLFTRSSRNRGVSALQAVTHQGHDGVDGYALYTTKPDWGDAGPAGTVQVREVVARRPQAYTALWRYLIDMDLMSTATAHLPTDDPLLHLLADPTRAVPRWSLNVWVRVVDLPTALALRRYAAPVDTVLEFEDPLLPDNTGRWRLSGDPSGAVCERTSEPAEITVSVSALGAAYLGGTALTSLAPLGRVVEHRAGALAAVSVAFGWHRAPFCPQVF